MGRPPSNGGPSFRFNPTEVAEMEAILQAHNTQVPAREVLVSLAEKFSASAERSGKVVVQMKQVWNWFQNRRYALRAKAAKTPSKVTAPVTPQSEPTIVRTIPQAPQPGPPPSVTVRPMIQAPQGTQPVALAAPSVSAGRSGSDNSQMEFEAKSARDGAWYDVAAFLSHRSMETGDPEVLIRFSGFGAEEDEWVNVRKNVRQRSLPCESSECVAVLPGDLILCFQEGKEQALYFDAHVLDAQRRRHDVRGCRCRFLVRYDHDQSEEIVPLRKICRRPETDYRLEQLNAESATLKQQKTGTDPQTTNTLRVYAPAETVPKPPTISSGKPAEPMAKKIKIDEHANAAAVTSSAHVDSSCSTLKQPKVVENVNAGSNLPPMEQQKTSNDAQTANTLTVYPPVESQKPPTVLVPRHPAESMPEFPSESKSIPSAEQTLTAPAEPMPESQSESELVPQAEQALMGPAVSMPESQSESKLEPQVEQALMGPAVSMPESQSESKLVAQAEQALVAPAESMPNPTHENTKEEEHANVAPVAPAMSSVPTPNPIETKDEQLNPEEHANVAATVAPVAPAGSSAPRSNPTETTDKQHKAEGYAHAAAAVAPDDHTDVSVANEYKNVLTKDAENVIPGNVGISETPSIQSDDVMVASCDAMNDTPDEVAGSTGLLNCGGDPGMLDAGGDIGMLDAGGGPGMLDAVGGPGMLDVGGDPGMLDVSGDPGMLDVSGDPGMLDAGSGPGMLDAGGGPGLLDAGGDHGMLDAGGGYGSVQQG